MRKLTAITIGVLLLVQGGPGYIFAKTENVNRQEMRMTLLADGDLKPT